MIVKLDEKNLKKASHLLAKKDPALERVLMQYGYPPLWYRQPGFSTLVHIILEQQVSLASANAAFRKLEARLGSVQPAAFLDLTDDALRALGFSRQKIKYTRSLAEAILENRLPIDQMEEWPEETVRATMMELPGIGHWTVDIYLSECLLRPDILPRGDIAMQEAFKVLNGLPARPTYANFVAATRHWRPWRSVGTRMLWHFYLCEKK